MTYAWLVVFVLALIAESLTLGLIAIWFALGALASVFAVFLGANLIVQVLVFCFVSALFLLLFIFFFKKKLKVKESTNINSLVNSCGVVEKTIEEKGMGRILVSSMSWQAKEENGKKIQEGEWVKVIDIKGVTLIVKKEKENEKEKE